MNLKHMLRNAIFRNGFMWKCAEGIKRKVSTLKSDCHICNEGNARIVKDFAGGGHSVIIHKGCMLKGTVIRIRGTNNRIEFEEDCVVGPECSFWMEGNNISIIIGAHTTFTRQCHINAQEDGSKIEIGRDCMFSNQIIVRTSDSHAIYDIESRERVNNPKDVILEDHVWIAPNTKIMKGACIGKGSIIGSDTTVSKKIPSNVLAVGRPAKVVKENVEWTREKLF